MTSVALEFDWRDAGEVRLAGVDKLEFPKLSSQPGVYAFRFTIEDKPATVYLGEAEDLQRRAAHYRNPGPSQATNIRLNQLMRSHLKAGGRVTMQLVSSARLMLDGSTEECDLSAKFTRRFLENAALLAAARNGQRAENL
jgi:hypothetical protein